ncbi:MAG TPA: type II toxin-antitoxin system HipA family toxin [Steroidobacteraceae bacterium]
MPSRRRIRELAVWANGTHVGDWRLPARGTMEFQYDVTWLDSPESRPLSLSLPITATRAPHKGTAVEAYFDNLLPDSEPIRRRLQQRFQTESRDAFDLLAAIGRDCVGAVQILPKDHPPADIRRIESNVLSDEDIGRELAGVSSAPNTLARNDDEFRISIAGAQEKTAFLRHQGRWCRPLGSTPTTHIFKLPLGLVGNRQADMRTSVENEWLCAQIAAAFGLPIARCEIGEFGPGKVVIVERFDRQLHSSGKFWLRLMQEDFAQATGTPWQYKYQADGGPGVLDLARLLRGSAEASSDLTTLFRSQLLFYLLAATDGHAKNFSIRILAGGQFRLTPLYDVLSAWPVIGKRTHQLPYEKARLAMALPGERPRYHLASLQRRHFELLGQKLGLGESTAALIDEMQSQALAVTRRVADQLPRGFPPGLAESVFQGMVRSAKRLSSTP